MNSDPSLRVEPLSEPIDTPTEASVLSEVSPRPWRVYSGVRNEEDGLYTIVGGRFVAGAFNLAEAALIVRAVNNHDALVKAAQDFVDKVDRGEARSTESYAAFKAALNSVRESSTG